MRGGGLIRVKPTLDFIYYKKKLKKNYGIKAKLFSKLNTIDISLV